MTGKRSWRNVVVVGIALGAMGLLVVRPPALAESDEVGRLKAFCEFDHAYHRRAIALRDLRELGTTEAKEALQALAASTDELLAAQAIAALGKAECSNCEEELLDIVGDANRTEFVRSMAVTAYCRSRKRDDASWSSVEKALGNDCEGKQTLEDAVEAAKAKLWEQE